MRTKPIRRDEVRFDGSRITTLPRNSVRLDKWGDPQPIRKLWAPLLRALDRAQRVAFAKRVAEWDSPAAVANRDASMQAGIGAWAFKRPEPPPSITTPRPLWGDPHTCCQCRKEFYRVQRSGRTCCSDKCAQAAHTAAVVQRRSAARAAKRADLECAVCGKRLQARRSTMRFCSVRCRVAAHRNANG
jgi:hypothetical protein